MTEYKIEFLKTAKKELSKLPKNIQKRIASKIEILKNNPYPSDFKYLTNGNGRLRIRVGDYRIIYRVENELLVVKSVKITEIYDLRKMPKEIW